ncbi:DUF3618 domain-containing protein [Microvirga pudoricolor]|uniref:DUF3618 domain-containing protein n=1 Tax=Microvirga pudoricolor TaxID=2778729 RepID=UPI00194F7751|nr:DUF3618 domain-containing protein [Microvirga pudoricolor]MBM6596258.1 DUF3618 domain-containing protein [Microvirga pudoricolor]
MSDDMGDLEREIEQTRARLDLTIDRLQDKLTVSGVVDDALGSVQRSAFAPVYDNMLTTIRQNPVPVMLVAAGMAMIFYRMTKPRPRRVKIAVVEEPLASDVVDDGFVLRPTSPAIHPGLEPLGPDLDNPSRRY